MDNFMISSYCVLPLVGVVRILLLYATVCGVKAGPSASFYMPRQFSGSTVSQFGGAWVLRTSYISEHDKFRLQWDSTITWLDDHMVV